MSHHLTMSIEDYLEAIYMIELKTRNKEVPSIVLAEHLNVSKSAVSKAMKTMLDDGYIKKDLYGGISLTSKGKTIAKDVYKKHSTLKEFLIKLGVSEETAEIDCCKIEHVISEETFKKIEVFNGKNSENGVLFVLNAPEISKIDEDDDSEN